MLLKTSVFGGHIIINHHHHLFITGFLSPGTSPLETVVHPTTQALSFTL
jgi:hypothetical protein